MPKTLAAALVGLALGGIFLPLWSDMVLPEWLMLDGFFSHGLAVVGLFGMLIWQDRQAVFGNREPGSWLWAAGALACGAAWFVGWAANVQALQLAAAVSLIMAAGTAVLGWSSWRTFAMPFALFYFAVPIWAPVQPALQSLAATIVERLVAFSGVPVLIEGTFVHIPAGVFEIARGCSGLGFLLVSLSLGGYLALSHRSAVWKTAAVAAGAVVLALVTNWLRIYIIIMIADYGGMDQKIVRSHDWLGWAVYAVLVLPLLAACMRWLERAPGSVEARSGVVRGVGRVSAGFVVAVLAMSLLFPGIGRGLDYALAFNTPQVVPLPQLSGYVRTQPDASGWSPEFPGADRVERVDYRVSGTRVMAFRATYLRQRDGAEAVNIVNDLGGSGWRKRGERELDLDNPSFSVTEHRFSAGDDRTLCVWSWYRIGSRYAGTDLDAKIAQVLEKARGRADASVTAVASVADGACESVASPLTEVTRGLVPGISL